MGLGRRKTASVPGLKRSRWTSFKAAAAARLGWLWRPQLYAGLLLGVLLGRAMAGSHVALFGIAFYAAVRGAGFSASASAPVAVAVLAGSASVSAGNLTQWFWILIAVCVCHVVATVVRMGRSGPSPLFAAALGSATAAIPAVAYYGQSNLVLLVFLTGLTGVVTLIFTIGIADATAGRLLHAGSSDSPVAAIVVLAAALSGLDGVTTANLLSLRDVAAGLVVLACAYAGGPPLGAAAGAVLGITFVAGAFTGDLAQLGTVTDFRGFPAVTLSMGYVVAGMLGGTFRDLRKPGVGLAYSLGLITWVMVTLQTAGTVFVLALGAVVSTLLFWAIPVSWLAAVPAALGPLPPPGARRTGPGSEPGANLVDRLAGMARVFKEIGRTFEQVATVAEAPTDHLPRVSGHVAERVCHSCSMYRNCWEKQSDRTHVLLADLWEQIDQEGPLSTHSVPAELEEHCIYPAQVAFALNYLHERERVQHHWERRLEEGRMVVADYLRNAARMLDRLLEDGEGSGGRVPDEPILYVGSGVARVPKRGSHISGDSFAGEAVSPGRYLLALSDGMGVGQAAAAQSKQCIALIREILRAGFSPEVAVKTANSALLLQTPEDTFATVDLALIDLTTARAEFIKVGAAPSFIKRGRDVTVVKTAAVPVGIINEVDVEPEFRNVRPGDLLIMITDGVWDVSKDDIDKERWLINHLARETATEPEAVAESVLARALELMPEAGDDMTVLVARVEPLGGGVATAPEGPALSQWAPVRRAPKLDSTPARKPKA